MSERQYLSRTISETFVDGPDKLSPEISLQLSNLKADVNTTITYLNGMASRKIRERIDNGTIKQEQVAIIDKYREMLLDAEIRGCGWLLPISIYNHPNGLKVRRSRFSGEWVLQRLKEGGASPTGFKEFAQETCKSALETELGAITSTSFRAMSIYYRYDEILKTFDATIKRFSIDMEISRHMEEQIVRAPSHADRLRSLVLRQELEPPEVEIVKIKPTFSVIEYDFNKSSFADMRKAVWEQIHTSELV